MSAVDPNSPPTLVSPGASPQSRALNNPISIITGSDTSPAVGSGGVIVKNGNVVAFSGGIPTGATYAIVWITAVLAGTTGLSVTVGALYVDAGTNWNIGFFWLNGSSVLQPDGAAEVRFKIYWY